MIRVEWKDSPLKLKSITVFSEVKGLEERISNLGFKLISEAVMVSDGKFWSKRLYVKGDESITVSKEIGDALYLRDPVITLCAHPKTIEKVGRALVK